VNLFLRVLKVSNIAMVDFFTSKHHPQGYFYSSLLIF
jgi:hypothetical protein